MFIRLIFGLTTFAIALSCFQTISIFAEEKSVPIKVGVIFPLSGDFARFGQSARLAMELALQREQGHDIHFVFEDNRTCGASDAVTAYRKLISVDNVQAIVCFCSAAFKAIAPLAAASHIPLIQTTESMGISSETFFKTMPSSFAFLEVLAEVLVKRYPSISVIATEHELNDRQQGSVGYFRRSFTAHGGKILSEDLFSADQKDFKTLLMRLKKLKPDAIVPFIFGADSFALFLKQAEQLHVWDQISLAGSFHLEIQLPELLKLYPAIKKFKNLDSVNFSATTTAWFKEEYHKAHGSDPEQFADYSYDAASMLRRCGLDLQCWAKPFDSASGRVEFDAQHQRTGKLVRKSIDLGEVRELN